MKKIPRKDLTVGSVKAHIIKLTFGMLGGFVSMCAFNIADTYFVSQLGKEYLAAMGFVGPIVMLIGSLAMGLGIAVAAIVARKIGGNDFAGVKRFMADTLIFSMILVMFLALIGLLSVEYVLSAMGASGLVQDLAIRYLNIWFYFVAFMVVPMIANNAIRATGHALIPAFIMGASAVINIFLDWLLIFGNWGFPRWELEGAVWATVISRCCGFVLAVCLLHFKFRIISFAVPVWSKFVVSCRELLATAIPAMGNSVLVPLSNMLIISMIASYGTAAVAGTNAGSQIIMFTFMLPMAMGSVLMPFAGQNWAAKKIERIREAWNFGIIFSIIYGALSFVLLFFVGKDVAKIFSNNPEVFNVTVNFLFIYLIFSAFCHIAVHTGFLFNAIGKPFCASVLYVLRFAVLMIPLAWLGQNLIGINGIFIGISVANLLTGLVAWIWFKIVIARSIQNQLSKQNA
jgi:MATE family, multidrug efflux pump